MAVPVLIVDDNPMTRGFLARVVRDSFSDALDLSEAGDLHTAGPLLDANAPKGSTPPFGLVIVNLELPDGSGLELLSQMSNYPALKVVTTLYADDEHLFPALQQGADGYLLKEDRYEVLVEELQRIVRGQPPLSPAIARRLLAHFRDTGYSSSQFGDSGHTPLDPSPALSEHDRLTPRENEVLTYLSKGFTVKEIASLMGIKWLSVNDHIKAIYRKLKLSTQPRAATT
ncbi:LuxR C-terminal-related transcriptional regulator [Caldimonas caldifontis]|uniref:DNA-binding response regulator n=1 Tax=Caldimonas caldifontis TaxID=1452508 RepID=A0A2S5SZ74_9BURK|nr:response regulator transcription factor [Caldimonas caldifontis]PPE67897.1 DNA-binding response regulator [Caldimonas caldifontis]